MAGKELAGLLARTATLDPYEVLVRAAQPGPDIQEQLDAVDVELVIGTPEAALAPLIAVIKRSAGEERNQARVRLLELFETLGNADERVLKARRDLMAALF